MPVYKNSAENGFKHGNCAGFLGLKNWQIQQYRASVDDYRFFSLPQIRSLC